MCSAEHGTMTSCLHSKKFFVIVHCYVCISLQGWKLLKWPTAAKLAKITDMNAKSASVKTMARRPNVQNGLSAARLVTRGRQIVATHANATRTTREFVVQLSVSNRDFDDVVDDDLTDLESGEKNPEINTQVKKTDEIYFFLNLN